MHFVKRAFWTRPLLVAGVAVATLATVCPASAYAAPIPGPSAEALAVSAAATAAEYKDKLKVAVKFGLGDDAALAELADRDFVIGIWNHVKDNPDQVEVRLAAEAAFTAGPDEVDALCLQFILTDVFTAFDRDVEREKREADAKRLSDVARSAAAASIDIVADAALLDGSDADFARLIWERVADDVKWPKVKSAAKAAYDGTAEAQAQFIATGLAEAAKQDTADRIAADEAKTEAEKAAAQARASRKLAANRVGLTVTDELLNLPDQDFIIEVWNNTPDGSEVQAAAIAATRSLDPAVWKAFIDTGIHAAKDRDIQIALEKEYQADKTLAQAIKAAAVKAGDLNLAYWTTKALAGTPTQLDDFVRIGQYDLDLTTSFDAGNVAPTWSNNKAWTTAVTNVGPLCCSLTAPELGVRIEKAHTGTAALMYSGLDNNATKSFAYLRSLSLSRITIKPTTKLTYWIYPETKAERAAVTTANSECVAVDLAFSDGKYLRDTGVVDSRSFRAHPAYQCAAVTAGKWNQVTVPLGSLKDRKITSLIVGYDQPAGTGGYRGYLDDITITD